MANPIYQELQGLARELLDEFSQGTITFIQVTPGNGPKQNPGPPVETPHPFEGVMRGVKFRYIDGTTIVATDLQCTMPAGIVEPKLPGFILADGVKYKVIKVDRKPSIGVAVAYTIIVKG